MLSSVGSAFFVSSNQANTTSNVGSNDEFQITLHNIPVPQSSNSYYAWLLPDKNNPDGVLNSAGSTQYQRQLATQINTGIENEQTWLGLIRKDAMQLAHMNNNQLAQQSTLTIINDMVTQATNAVQGFNNPSTGTLEEGYSQIYLQIQKLATFDVKPYTSGQ